MRRSLIIIFILSLLCLSTVVHAAPTQQTLGFQGEFFNYGTPGNAPVQATFTFHTTETGNTPSGSTITKIIPVVHGYFATEFTDTDTQGVDFNQQLYLEISINGTTLSPRTPVRPSVASFKTFGTFSHATPPTPGIAGSLYFNTTTNELYVSTGSAWQLAGTASTTIQWTPNGTSLNYMAGNVGVGTSTPETQLSVVGGSSFDYLFTTSTTSTSTIAGFLSLESTPVLSTHATNKNYVDNLVEQSKSFPQTLKAPLATKPPKVTISPEYSPSPTIPNGVLIPMTSSVFRYYGAKMQVGSGYPNGLLYFSTGLNSTYGSLPSSVEFVFTGQEMEIFHKMGGGYRLTVDGERVTEDFQPLGTGDGSIRYVKVTFDSRKTRTIKFEDASGFGGVVVGPSDTISAPFTKKGKRAIFLGDSFTEPANGYVNTTSRILGWDGWASGSGGTGYVNRGIPGVGRVNFTERVQSDVIDHNPDVVVIAGGINDGNHPDLQTNAEYVYQEIRDKLPQAKLIVVGPWWPNGNPVNDILLARDKLKASAEKYNAVFIDPIGEQWITGQRGDCTTGNACLYTSDDNTHPTQAGNDYLGERLAARILELAPDAVSVNPTSHIDKLSSSGGIVSGKLALVSATGTALIIGNRLLVNSANTNDSLAESIFTSGSSTRKALVLQGALGQTANLQEWQNSAGQAISLLTATGNLVLGTTTVPHADARLLVKGSPGKIPLIVQTADESGIVAQFKQAGNNFTIAELTSNAGGGQFAIGQEGLGNSSISFGTGYDSPYFTILRSSASSRSNFITLSTRGSGDWSFGNDYNDDTTLRIRRNSTDLMSFLANGNVGIGTSTPTTKLSIDGDFKIKDLVFRTTIGSKTLSIGENAGEGAINAIHSNFIGDSAGQDATSAIFSNFFGNYAGYQASSSAYSNFFGQFAGFGAANALYSNFIGQGAGNSATNARNSNFIGWQAGRSATNASYSNFIGQNAGNGAFNAANSIIIGNDAGYYDSVNNTSGNKSSILIGNYTSTGGFSNSIAIGQGTQNSAVDQLNIGNVLYATGISSSTTASAAPIANGRFGIGTSTPTATLTSVGSVRFASLTGAGASLIVDSLGNVTVSSDERLKDIQGDFITGLDKIKGITPILYKWKEETGYDTSSTYAGFSAQNIQENIPEAVTTDSKGFLTLADRPILATLVNAVKELAEKIESFAKEFKSDKIRTKELCIEKSNGTEVCLTGDQVESVLYSQQSIQVNTAPSSVAPVDSTTDEVIDSEEEPEELTIEPVVVETTETTLEE